MRIAIDLDGVVTDTELAVLMERSHLPGFFTQLEPVAGAIDGVAALARKHDVLICSSAMYVPHAFGEKFAWLRTHLPVIGPDRIVFCGEKDVLLADVLVDDSLYDLARFAGRGILFTRPYNAHDPYPNRARDWPDLLVMLGADG